MIKRFVYFLSILALVGSFVVPTNHAYADQASRCDGFSVLSTPGCKGYDFNRDYYSNTGGIQGQNILYNTTDISDWAVPASIDTVSEFTTYIKNFLGATSDYNYNRAGAAFTVNTMLGEKGNCNGNFCNVTDSIAYAQAHVADWETRVNYADSKGWIQWNYTTTLNPGDINSMHACTQGSTSANCNLAGIIAGNRDAQDFTFYRISAGDGAEVSHEIRFSDASGLIYRLRRECANLIGDARGLTAPPNYNLSPSINAQVKDGATNVPGNVAEDGNTVTFTYAIVNSGDASDSVDCTIYANNHTGQYTITNPPEKGAVKSKADCPRTFPGQTTTTLSSANETIAIGAGDINKSICRTLYVNPFQSSGGERGTEVCIVIAAKPYVKVFGGDVSAGNGISVGNSSTCTQNSTASINSWNRGSSSFLGSGTQFAAMALGTIDQFSTAQNIAGTKANMPDGLAFSNTVSNGTYGGGFGTLPCIPDYYSQAANTSNVTSPVDVASLNGAYKATGSVTINGGTIPTGKRTTLYVDGDVYINGNISYVPAAWSYNDVPLFELIVKGNIYIAPGVSRLDGAYIAQQSGGTKGAIYTCATATGPYALDGGLYSACKTKLTVNGLFSASQVYLMRTFGTLSQSTVGETAGSSNAGEVFNYNPTMWIAQPPTGSNTNNSKVGDYDAITSLPPVL